MAPIRALGEPVFDLLAERPYTELQSLLDATEPKGAHYYWKTGFTGRARRRAARRPARELAAECPIPHAQIGILHVGGALNERADDDGAVGNRDARYVRRRDRDVGARRAARRRSSRPGCDAGWERCRPFCTGGNYINFQTADEGAERIRASYGANYERLLEVKRAYDPGNVFRSNRNVG